MLLFSWLSERVLWMVDEVDCGGLIGVCFVLLCWV